MPRIHIKMKEKDGTETECWANGFFILHLSFRNHPRIRLKKFVKEYGIGDKNE